MTLISRLFSTYLLIMNAKLVSDKFIRSLMVEINGKILQNRRKPVASRYNRNNEL